MDFPAAAGASGWGLAVTRTLSCQPEFRQLDNADRPPTRSRKWSASDRHVTQGMSHRRPARLYPKYNKPNHRLTVIRYYLKVTRRSYSIFKVYSCVTDFYRTRNSTTKRR